MEIDEVDKNDINNIYYIGLEIVKNIKMGKEIFGVFNQPFLDDVNYLRSNSFPPVY